MKSSLELTLSVGLVSQRHHTLTLTQQDQLLPPLLPHSLLRLCHSHLSGFGMFFQCRQSHSVCLKMCHISNEHQGSLSKTLCTRQQARRDVGKWFSALCDLFFEHLDLSLFVGRQRLTDVLRMSWRIYEKCPGSDVVRASPLFWFSSSVLVAAAAMKGNIAQALQFD